MGNPLGSDDQGRAGPMSDQAPGDEPFEDDRIGRVKRRLRFEFVKEDAWVGLFWKRRRWFGGFDSAALADDPEKAHRRLDWYVCLLPCVPLHYTAERCPAPMVCTALSCTASLVRRCGTCKRVMPRVDVVMIDRSHTCLGCLLETSDTDEQVER